MTAPKQAYIEISLIGLEANTPISFPWTDELEGKTIVGVETFTFQAANNPSLSFSPLTSKNIVNVSVASRILVTFKNYAQQEILHNMPYLALRRTGTYVNFPAPLTVQIESRQIRPKFAFTFSSKDSSFIYCAPNPPKFIVPTVLYFVFKYL